MDENNIPTKKFKVTFEFDAIPYNEETYELIGDSFFSEWPEDIYVKEDLDDLFQNALFGSAYTNMVNNLPAHNMFMKMLDQMRSSVKIGVL